MPKLLQYQSETLFAFITITIVFLILAALIAIIVFLHTKKVSYLALQQRIQKEAFEKQLLQSQVEVQESTYTAMSKELHDNVGQLLSSAKMMLGVLQIEGEKPSETLKIVSQTVGMAITEIRTLSKSFSKEWLEQFDLVENLATEVKRINTAQQLTIHFTTVEKLALISNRQIILFRIIQEAMQNAIKHAFSKNIYINILVNQSTITIVVEDDGKGFDTNCKSNGLGTLNMRQRAHLLNGNIAWTSHGTGCTITVNIPLLPEEI